MDIAWYCWVLLPLAGFVGMYSGGYWGVGCSWLIVSIMLLLGATPMEAAGVALLQMVPSMLPTAIKEAPKLGWKKGDIGLNLVLPLMIVSGIFSFSGRPVNAYFYERFGDVAFRCFFAAIMVYLCIKVLASRPQAYGSRVPRFGAKTLLPVIGAGSVIGSLSALLGVGGGVFFRPLLAVGFKIPERETARAVRMLLLSTTFFGGISYVLAPGGIDWHIPAFAGLVTIGGMLGFPFGVRLHKTVYEAGYALHIHKSFAIIAFLVVLNQTLNLAGYKEFARLLMIAMSVFLFLYLWLFGVYAKRHPRVCADA